MKSVQLAFTGLDGAPVPHEFLRQDGGSDRLAIFLPGYRYTCDMPLFYYLEALLLARGADLLRLLPAYATEHGFNDLPHLEMETRIAGDAAPAVRAALAERSYGDVIVIAKSLGTMTLARLVKDGVLPPSARLVWAPPLLYRPSVVEALSLSTGRGLLVIGTRDLEQDQIQLDGLSISANVEIMILGDADHSFDIPGDVGRSIVTLGAVVDRVDSFVEGRAR